jgi:hypothetical protein
MDELPLHVLDLTHQRLAEFRRSLLRCVHACNPDCYSNCAFDGAYYRTHIARLMWKFIAVMGVRPQHESPFLS